ncbi:hypothetical protein [Burkholderia oklahomensis]|uniref:hypothetical protein n=2 Tax=Burkholderia oklahomensis TaxID=342113 RepID=UPI000A52F248|nr:hypothetical protein [Burkholderia oklahomensis]
MKGRCAMHRPFAVCRFTVALRNRSTRASLHCAANADAMPTRTRSESNPPSTATRNAPRDTTAQHAEPETKPARKRHDTRRAAVHQVRRRIAPTPKDSIND